MINAIPLLGWLLSFVFSVSLALPFWICWTNCKIGETYFYFLPVVFQSISFWHCVGLFLCISILKSVLIPKIVEVNSKAD